MNDKRLGVRLICEYLKDKKRFKALTGSNPKHDSTVHKWYAATSALKLSVFEGDRARIVKALSLARLCPLGTYGEYWDFTLPQEDVDALARAGF